MEMYKKRFIPKNKLLQYDLDTFLYWRFKTFSSYSNSVTKETNKENNHRPTPTTMTRLGTGLLVGKKAKKPQIPFLLSNTTSNQKAKPFLPFSSFVKNAQIDNYKGQGAENSAPFFPEKKNFMQFWALPLLGASFLSFLTFENRGFSKPVLNGNSKNSEMLNLKEVNFQKTLPSPLNQTFKEHSTLSKEFYISDIPVLSLTTPISYSSRITNKERNQLSHSEKNLYTQEIQKLCLFYLNLTEEKLLSSLDLPKGENFSKMFYSPELKENLLLKSLYLQNSFFHWHYYPLYDPSLISNLPFQSNEHLGFLQKLNPGLSFCMSASESEQAQEFFEPWTKNPTLSYLKSTQFFENWLLKLQAFQTVPQNLDNVSNVALESSKKLFMEKAKDTVFREAPQKSQTVEFFHKFLQKLNQSQITWMQVYETLKHSKSLNISEGNSETMAKQVLENFEKKYKQSNSRLVFQRKYLTLLQKQGHKTLSLEKELKKQKFNTFLKKHLNQSLFQRRLESKIDLLVSKQEGTFQSPAHQHNLKSNLKNSVYDLLLLKDLNLNLSVSKAKEKTSQDSLKTYTADKAVNTEIMKNPEKWLQEIQLYSQLQKIQKIFLHKLKNTKQNTDTSSISKKSHLSFSKKEKPQNSPTSFGFHTNPSNHKANRPELAVQTGSVEFAHEQVQSGPHSTPVRFYGLGDRSDLSGQSLWSANANSELNLTARPLSEPWKLFLTDKISLPWEVISSRLGSKALEKPKRFKRNMRLFGTQRNKGVFTQSLIKKTSRFGVTGPSQRQNFQNKLRSSEKLFRSYLSIKNVKGLQNKKPADFFLRIQNSGPQKTPSDIYRILQQLKKNAIFSNSSPAVNWVEPKQLSIQNLEKSLTSSKSNTLNTFANKDPSYNQLEFRKLQDFLFLKKANFLKNSSDLNASAEVKIFEKKKSLEKRRRLKKLKLENRRRKKRKRFYPRPQMLRFHCYLNFLQKRHIIEPQNLKQMDFSENRNGRSTKVKILNRGRVALRPMSIISGARNAPFGKTPVGVDGFLSKPLSDIAHHTEFYKISNQTLTEFERLCWKSYWLRSNLKPYVLKIQKSLRRMKQVENFKTKQHVPTFLEFLHKSKHSSFLKTTPGYANLRENLQSFQTSFISPFDSFTIKAEYERLLYERMNDEIKNVKSQLTVDGQSQARSYKTGRQKLEKNLAKPFWNPFFEFSNNYLEPNLDTATSILNAPFLKTDFAKKDFPTLRLLWACQKSQLFTYQSNNSAQNLWTTYKIREQTKNNKTRKFFYRLSRKLTDFTDWAHIAALEKSKADSEKPLATSLVYAQNYEQNNPSDSRSRGNDQEPKNQKFHLNSVNRYQDKKLQDLSTFKTKRANQKMQTFGGFLSGKNYHTYLKNVKFQLQQQPISKKELLNREKQKSSTRQFRNTDPLVETNFQSPIQKRQFHFWWSVQKPAFPFMLSFLFSKSENASFYVNAVQPHFNFSKDGNSAGLLPFAQQEFISQTFWLCACVLHLGIFFALIRLPEIRSLVKFQILIVSKVCNVYLLGIFALYDLLKSYAMKIKRLTQNVLKLSTPDFQSLEQNQNTSSSFKDSGRTKLSSKFFQPQNKLNITSTQQINTLRTSSPSWMHSTVHWKFVHKSFFYPENKANQSSNSRLVSAASISPMFGKTQGTNRSASSEQDVSVFLNSKPSADPTSLKFYDSWSTGFVWKMVLKNFTKPNLRLGSVSETMPRISSDFSKDNRNKLSGLDKAVDKFKERQQKEISSSVNSTFSYGLESNIQIQTFLTLGVLWGTRFCFSVLSLCLNVFYKMVFQLIDVLEGTLFIFYKFLEKPAEVLVDWIAEVFLVEWTSDVHTYVPEAFDTGIWNSTTKFSRSARFFYGFPFGFVVQRFFLESTQLFYQWLLKPESDLRIRQKKGIIFWDIWSEILIQAAEKYKMNLSSLSTVKDEQELLIENLVEEKWIEGTLNTKQKKQGSLRKLDQIKMARKNPGSKTDLLKNETNVSSVDQEFQPSLMKLDPLMKFIQNAPSFYQPVKNEASVFPSTFLKNEIFSDKFFEQLPVRNGVHANFLNFQLTTGRNQKKEQALEIFSENFKEQSLKRWSATQYLNTQGKDTDLFMDIHPPKSFAHVSFLKSYLPAQEILGSLVCEIYAGLFSSKVSKNVLIVGAPGMAKSFFIQALAGETELKIVLDNAHRYAFVNGGVPVGMKLLREVFDSMALHTPCLFLLEDVHVIGERRPMLISDDETSKTKEFAFGAEQEEVHEKNKLVYQLSKHALSHYKKPYKGDFSLAIPTNHFCYDLFLGVSPPRKRRADLTASSPLPIQALNSALDPASGANSHAGSGQSFSHGSGGSNASANNSDQTLLSSLQISVAQVFAPPATSPFHVLLMKEQKKLKPKKLVKDVPWSGLSYDQWMLLSKSNYSVRVKVALLAETAMKNLSVKLDMITDLLVIIDSVRSNRGFVVFATTHLPALLDPALRRPGRLDETISLPLLPNIQTRFEIFRTRLSSYTQSMDFFDWSLYSGQLKHNENQLANFLDKNILALFNSKQPIQAHTYAPGFNLDSSSLFVSQRSYDYPITSLSQAFQSSLSLQSMWANVHQFKKMLSLASLASQGSPARLTEQRPNQTTQKILQNPQSFFAGETKRNYIALSYAQTGQFLTEALLLKEQETYTMKFVGNTGRFAGKEFSRVDNQKFMYQSLYSSNFETKQTLFKLLASKIAEFFVFQIFCPALSSSSFNSQLLKFEKPQGQFYFGNLNRVSAQTGLSQPTSSSDPSDQGLPDSGFGTQDARLRVADMLPSNMFQYGMAFNNLQTSVNNWQSATSFLDSIFQKRYLYNKNSIVLKMLFFEDKISLGEPPSPPNSSILNPARKFENYQKTLRDFMQKPGLTINEKLQMHQKQRFLKLLYNVPPQSAFRSAPRNSQNQANKLGSSFTNGSSSSALETQNFYASFKELGYLDLVTLRPSSTYAFYKSRLFHRQRFSFLNQWWNGQLAEHNAETTYLSHIDWRSMFVQSLGDVFLDFPDAEQYYNPRNRRWFLQSKTWSYWLNFEVQMREQISEHFLIECFTQTAELLHSNRELTDYLAYRFLRNHQLHELDLLQVLVRFYKKKHMDT